jgi:phosphopantothenoylcysteine decarboxylase/phosphopantothenate--cysteine ligase
VKAVSVKTTAQMRERAVEAWEKANGAVLVAAVSDFRPVNPAPEKIKKRDGIPEIRLERTEDILSELSRSKGNRLLAGFAAETSDLLKNAQAKLVAKNADMIIANDVSSDAVGFGTDKNSVIILRRDGTRREVPMAAKHEVAWEICDEISVMMNGK